MTKYSFEGNWYPKIKLDILTKLGHENMFDPNGREWVQELYDDHKSNKVQLRIFPAKNANQYPEAIQLNAVNYIIENEEQIYSEIFKTLLNIIYPHYTELYQENIQEYAPLNSIVDMPLVLGLIDIQIELIGNNEIAWSIYNFNWQGEEEHGLSLLLEGSKFIQHSGCGDMWVDEFIPKDKLSQYNDLHNLKMPQKMYYPINNRKFYKPWELELTSEYLINLLKDNRYSEFEKHVINTDFNVNQKFPDEGLPLIELVLKNGFVNSAKLLHDLGAKTNGLMHYGNIRNNNLSRIEFIYNVHGDLDEKNKDDKSLLEVYLEKAKAVFDLNNKIYSDKLHILEKLEIAQRDNEQVFDEKMDLYRNHILLLLQFGAKLNEKEKFNSVMEYLGINSSK